MLFENIIYGKTNCFYFLMITTSYRYFIILFSEDINNRDKTTDTIFDAEAGPSTSALKSSY